MPNFRFWIPAIAGALVTPVSLYLTALSTGAGHGSYAAAIVLYPLSMVILILFAGFVGFDAFATNIIQSISLAVVVGLAILQYPFYGFVLSYGRLKHSWSARLATGLIYLHLVGISVYLVIGGFMWTIGAS